MADVLVCKSGELADGAVRIVTHDSQEVAVIRQSGKYYPESVPSDTRRV